jgi:hypothetical protein
MKAAYKNKYLIVPEKVVLTDELDKKLTELDIYFKDHPETVTSGLRTVEDQLRIIRKYLKVKGLDKKYPDTFVCDANEKYTDKNEFIWQMAWSNLLYVGVIVNPPYPATCLMDYFRGGINKKGLQIGQSPHTRGKAFDLSGLDSEPIVHRLRSEGKVRGYLIERENNCLHVDI